MCRNGQTDVCVKKKNNIYKAAEITATVQLSNHVISIHPDLIN